MIPKNGNMLPRARELRHNMTPQEKKLWYLYLKEYPAKFYKQKIIESFVVDFFCAQAKLVIEIDGKQHYTEQGLAYDRERSDILKKYNLSVLRFSNQDVDMHFEFVCQTIDAYIKENGS